MTFTSIASLHSILAEYKYALPFPVLMQSSPAFSAIQSLHTRNLGQSCAVKPLQCISRVVIVFIAEVGGINNQKGQRKMANYQVLVNPRGLPEIWILTALTEVH